MGGEVEFTVSRKIDTLDALDYLITPGQQINCAWAINPFTWDPRSIHTMHDRWAFKLDVTQVDSEINSSDDSDNTADWLPAGPIAVKPEYSMTYM